MPASRHIPTFSLYGEQPAVAGRTDSLHIEDIASRSRKYLWKISTHRHSHLCQCVFVVSGSVTVDLDASRSVLEGPAVIIIPSGTVHGFRFGAETKGYVLTTDLDRLLSMATVAHQAPIQALFATPRAIDLNSGRELAKRAAQLFECLLEEFQQREGLTTPIASWLACSVLWVLTLSTAGMAADVHSGHDLNRLRRFRWLIESHYLRHWSAARYAAPLGLSETSLNRLCRRLTGHTAFDLIQQRMALEARRRLAYVPGSVAALAAELGFKDAAYFCRFFRRHNGMSPGEYRRRQGGG